MSTYVIKWLKDKLGTRFFPVTHINAVRDDEGTSLASMLEAKQDTLVSGTNIKTVNNNSLVGSGNVSIATGDTNVIETVKVNNAALTPDANKAVNITAVTTFNGSSGAITYTAPVSSVNGQTGAVSIATGDTNVIETVKVNNTALTPDSNKAVNISAVTSFNGSTGAVTYTAPVTSVNGETGAVTLAIPSEVTDSTVSGWGFTKNVGTITGITMNGASKGTSGVVNLGTVITSHQDISGKADKSTTLAGYGITDAYTKTETDGRYFALYGATNLSPSSTNTINLNTETTPGSYYATSNANYVNNRPVDRNAGFRVWVLSTIGTNTNYIRQRFQYYDQFEIYERVTYNGGTSWGAWTKVQDNLANYSINTSDERLKNKIGDITLNIKDISNAPNITFTWKGNEDKSLHGGSTAQYWEKITPYYVRGEETKILEYSPLSLSCSIQLAKEVVQLKEENAQLKKELAEIKKMLSKLNK